MENLVRELSLKYNLVPNDEVFQRLVSETEKTFYVDHSLFDFEPLSIKGAQRVPYFKRGNVIALPAPATNSDFTVVRYDDTFYVNEKILKKYKESNGTINAAIIAELLELSVNPIKTNYDNHADSFGIDNPFVDGVSDVHKKDRRVEEEYAQQFLSPFVKEKEGYFSGLTQYVESIGRFYLRFYFKDGASVIDLYDADMHTVLSYTGRFSDIYDDVVFDDGSGYISYDNGVIFFDKSGAMVHVEHFDDRASRSVVKKKDGGYVLYDDKTPYIYVLDRNFTLQEKVNVPAPTKIVTLDNGTFLFLNSRTGTSKIVDSMYQEIGDAECASKYDAVDFGERYIALYDDGDDKLTFIDRNNGSLVFTFNLSDDELTRKVYAVLPRKDGIYVVMDVNKGKQYLGKHAGVIKEDNYRSFANINLSIEGTFFYTD